MTEKLRQSLSAAIDDEADAFELRRVLDELDRSVELRAAWDRYHLIGCELRGERTRLAVSVSERLRDRVWSAVTQDETETVGAVAEAPPRLDAAPDAAGVALAAPKSRLGRLTGLAVAASVAFAVVLGFNGSESEQPALQPAVVTAESPVSEVIVAPENFAPVGVQPPRPAPDVTPSDLQRAHAYMLHHAQHQALNQFGVMSIAKMATYEAP